MDVFIMTSGNGLVYFQTVLNSFLHLVFPAVQDLQCRVRMQTSPDKTERFQKYDAFYSNLLPSAFVFLVIIEYCISAAAVFLLKAVTPVAVLSNTKTKLNSSCFQFAILLQFKKLLFQNDRNSFGRPQNFLPVFPRMELLHPLK